MTTILKIKVEKLFDFLMSLGIVKRHAKLKHSWYQSSRERNRYLSKENKMVSGFLLF